MHDLYLFLGFTATEVCFYHLEHWVEVRAEHFREARHAAWIAWLAHPSLQGGLEHWINHMIPTALHLKG